MKNSSGNARTPAMLWARVGSEAAADQRSDRAAQVEASPRKNFGCGKYLDACARFMSCAPGLQSKLQAFLAAEACRKCGAYGGVNPGRVPSRRIRRPCTRVSAGFRSSAALLRLRC